MTNGFSGTGGFHNNRKSASSFSSPWANGSFIDIVYRNRQTQSAFAYWILQNGNMQSNRIRNFYTVRK